MKYSKSDAVLFEVEELSELDLFEFKEFLRSKVIHPVKSVQGPGKEGKGYCYQGLFSSRHVEEIETYLSGHGAKHASFGE